MRISFSAITSRGRIRSENQDYFYCDGYFREGISNHELIRYSGTLHMPALFAVADGMGGEANGALAALEVIRGLKQFSGAVTSARLVPYLRQCNHSLCRMIERNGGQRMGTTFVSASFYDDQVCIMNLGDSRAYWLKNGKLAQLSRDHTAVSSMVDMGLLTVSQAKSHPERHKLTQHLGIFEDEMIIEPNVVTRGCELGDRFLLCSDGLTDSVDDIQIQGILSAGKVPEDIAKALYEQALVCRSKDNITVVIVEITAQ